MPIRRRPKAFLERESPARFEFFLAERLHMTVGELRERMSAAEFLQWGIYYGIRAQEIQIARG